jgi:hypothetical protein
MNGQIEVGVGLAIIAWGVTAKACEHHRKSPK